MFEAFASWAVRMVDVDEEILPDVVRDGLTGVCLELGASRGLYFGFQDAGRTAVVQIEWSAPGLPSALGAEYTEAEAGDLFALLRAGEIVVCTADGEEPELAPLRDILHAERLAADLIVPVQRDGMLRHAVVIDFVEPPAAGVAGLRRVGGAIQDLLARAERRLAEELDRRERERVLHHKRKLQALGTMVGGVLHDINNVLQVVLGLSELIEVESDACRRAQMTEDISRSVRRGADLCQRILLFSRQEVRPAEAVGVAEHLRGLEPMLRSALTEDRRLHLDVALEEQTVVLPPVELEQAVVNLVTNAIDATGPGDRVVVRARALGDGERIEIAVTDTGRGMDADTLERATEAFFTTKPAGAGTGLGLAMIQRAMDAAGGWLELESTVGEGTVARLILPIGSVADTAPPEQPQAGGGDETLLLVEDDAMVRRVTASGLRRRGYTVLQAAEGREALDLLEQHGDIIELVITDVVMPELGGVELYRQVAARREPPPFLFATGYDAGHLVVGFAPAPGRDVLIKPYSLGLLQARIRSLLDDRSLAPAQTGPSLRQREP